MKALDKEARERALNVIADAAREGLSLQQGAALAGVTHRRLAAWIELGDEGHEPWASWLLGVCRSSAESRLALLKDLKQLGDVEPRARRDYLRERGAPSSLERELAEHRRVGAAWGDAKAELEGIESSERRHGLFDAYK